MAHGLVLRMQDYIKKIGERKESTYPPVDEPDTSSVEVVPIINSWLVATRNSKNSRMEFFSLLRQTLLFMLSSNWTRCMDQDDLLQAFRRYHQKFSTIVKNADKIKNSVIQMSKDPWGNPFFLWTEMETAKLTVADKKVQNYFAQEPEDIVLARVQSFVSVGKLPLAMALAKLSFLYHSRITKNIAIQPSDSRKSKSSFEDVNGEGLASIDWYMALLERKKSLSSIIKEVSHINCHEGVEIILRLKRNPHFKNLSFTLIQIFVMQDLIKPSKYCCTKKLFELFCLIHAERNSSVKEVTESIEKVFAAHAPSSSHLYLLVECMWERFGKKFSTLYIEFYIRGLTADINRLEVAKTDEGAVCDKNELETHLAKIFVKMSTLFNFNEEARRDCLFSAFILKPSMSRFSYLEATDGSVQKKYLEDPENSNSDLPFRDCTCSRICNGYCKTSPCDSTFEHPLLKKGIRNVPFTLVEDLVCVLESIRCLKFQYNIFSWRDSESKLRNYLESYLRKNRSSVSSADSNHSKIASKKVSKINSSVLKVTSVDATKNKVLTPKALIKRKNSSDNSKSDFLDVGANIEVNSDDISSKRIKMSLPSSNQESPMNFISKIKMVDAIEKVIRSSLNDKISKEQTSVSTAASILIKDNSSIKNDPINSPEDLHNVYIDGHRAYNDTNVTHRTTLVTENKKLYVSRHEVQQDVSSFERPSVVMKAENFSDKVHNLPHELSKHSLLKSSLTRVDSHQKPSENRPLKSNLSYKSEHFRNTSAQKSVQSTQLQQTNQIMDRNNNYGAINLSSTKSADPHHFKSQLQTSSQYPLDLKCNKKFVEALKPNRAICTLNESVSNQNVSHSNQMTNKLSNIPAITTKTVDRNSVIQHTMQHLDVKIPKNLTVSIISDSAQQGDASNLPAFKVKVPNKSIPPHSNFLSANLVIPRTHSSNSASTAIASDKTSSHVKQEMISIPGILAPKSVIKRSWEVPSVHSNVELKKIIHSSSTTKRTFCHPYQKHPMSNNLEWPKEYISKTEKVKKETTYQIYKTKQVPDNINLDKWKRTLDEAIKVPSPNSSTHSQLSRNSVRSSVSTSNSQLLSVNTVSLSNSSLQSTSYQNNSSSRTASPFLNNTPVQVSHRSNTPTSMPSFEKPPLCSYSYQNNVPVSNLLQSKPSYNLKGDRLVNSGQGSRQEKRTSLPLSSTHSLLKTSLTSPQTHSHAVKRVNSPTVQFLDYPNSKGLQSSNATNYSTTGVTSRLAGTPVPTCQYQNNVPYSQISYRSSENDRDNIFKATTSEIPYRHNTSNCCSPSEVNPCQNCSLPSEETNFNSTSTNPQIFNHPSVSLNSANQIKYDVNDLNEEKDLFQNQQLLQCTSQDEFTACHICSITCSFANYQLHLEKYHPSVSAKNFDVYDLQSTSFDTKDITHDILNINPVENKTDGIDLPQNNQDNLNMCMNLINNSFDQVVDYLDSSGGSMAYSNDSSFKFSDMLQNPQDNAALVLENSSTSGALELESSFIDNNICDNNSNLDEMLEFLGNSADLSASSQPSESLVIEKCTAAAPTPENYVSNIPPNNNQLVSTNNDPSLKTPRINKRYFCKLCLKMKERKFSSRGGIYKHFKTFHPKASLNDCMGVLINGQVPGKASNYSSNQNMLQTSDTKMFFQQNSSREILQNSTSIKMEPNETTLYNFNDDFELNNTFERYPLVDNKNLASHMDAMRPSESHFDPQSDFSSMGRKTKHPQSKCLYCGKMLTVIYMRQHILKMHPESLQKNYTPSNISSNYPCTSLPDEFKQSLPIASDLTQENIDSNTCLSVSDALKTDEKYDNLLNVSQKPTDCVNSPLLSSKFIPNNKEPTGQSLNNFSDNSTHVYFTCHLCQRRYTSPSFLSKHIKTYHAINDMAESVKSDTSFNEISDSSKFSDTNNSELNHTLMDVPFEKIPESFGNYNYVENNQLNTNVFHGDNFCVNDSCRDFESHNYNPSSTDLLTYDQHETPDEKPLLQSNLNKFDTIEMKDDYSNQFLTNDCKITQASDAPVHSPPDASVESKIDNSAKDDHVTSENASDPVNYHKLPRFTCPICQNTYSGKAYFRKHYKTKHNRLISEKEIETFQNFDNRIKPRVKAQKKSETPGNQLFRRLSLEVSKSNYSGVNNLLCAEARSNERVPCKICNKVYSNRGNLKIHMKNVHNYRGLRQRITEGKKREVQCHICLKLLQNTSLKLHVQTAHGEGFLTDQQEAYTVSNVVALSAVNYCARSVSRTLPKKSDCNTSSQSNSSGLAANVSEESKHLNQKEKLSDVDCTRNLRKLANVHTPQYNEVHQVSNVSSHSILNEVSNGATSKLKIESYNQTDAAKMNYSNLEYGNRDCEDQSDFEDYFSLSDIPTSDDECTDLMDKIMLQTEFLQNRNISDLAKENNNVLNCEDMPLDSYESNVGPSLDADSKSKSIENNELINHQTSPFSVLKDASSHSIHKSISKLTSDSLGETQPSSYSIPETLPELSIGGYQSSIQEMNSVSDLSLNEEKLKSASPKDNSEPDPNICTTWSSTDDESSVMLSGADSPLKINTFSVNVEESKMNSNECRFCHKIFTTMKFLSKHLKISHNIPFLKKQKSALKESDEKLSPPLLTQHLNCDLYTVSPSLEGSQNLDIPMVENENKFIDKSIEISNHIESDLLPRYEYQANNCADTSLSHLSTGLQQSCESLTSLQTNIVKEISVDRKCEHSDSNCTEKPCDITNSKSNLILNSSELVSDSNVLNNSKDGGISYGFCNKLPPHYVSDHKIEHASDELNVEHSSLISDEFKSDPTSHPFPVDHEIEQTSPALSDDHSIEHQGETSKAPILPCIIKVLKNEKNAIIYQIDKSKEDISIISESKSSPNLNRFFRNHKNSSNLRNRKKFIRSPYQSNLYSKQRSLMRRKPRTLFVRRRKIIKRRKRKTKPVIQTFNYPDDVVAFLKNHKQPVVRLTRLKEGILEKLHLDSSAHKEEEEKQVFVRLKKCDNLNLEHPAQSELSDISELPMLVPNRTCMDDHSSDQSCFSKFRRNSDVQESGLAVVLHKLQIGGTSSVPLSDLEISTYKNCMQLPIIKECRVVIKRLPLRFHLK